MTGMRDRRLLYRLLVFAATVALYGGLNRFGVLFTDARGISLVFPATAVAVVAGLWFGLPAVLGVAVAVYATPWGNETPAELALAAAAMALEAFVPWAVFRSVPGLDCCLKDLRSFLHFVAAGVLGNTFATALFGSLATGFARTLTGTAATNVVQWWFADAIAALVFTMPLVMLATPALARTALATIMPPHARRPSRLQVSQVWRGPWRLETVGMTAAAIAITAILVWSDRTGIGKFHWYAVLYMIPILWAAIRFGVRGGATASAVVAVLYLTSILTGFGSDDLPLQLAAAHKVMTLYANILVFTLSGVAAGFLSDSDRALRRRLQQSNRLLQANTLWVLQALAAAVEQKDPHAPLDLARIESLCLALGHRFGLPAGELEDLRLAAILHDVGKIAVPDEVLLKPDLLLPEERRLADAHSDAGARILASVETLARASELVRLHHAPWHGGRGGSSGGTSTGSAGEPVPLAARIIAVVDAYDALRQPRTYRQACDHAAAVEVLREEAGDRFDPQVVAALIELFEDKPGA